MTHTIPKDIAEAKALLHAGRLEMKRPWGDWVRIRPRAGKSSSATKHRGNIPVFMENQVEASITKHSMALGFPDLRVTA